MTEREARLALLFLLYRRLQDCPVDHVFKYLKGVRVLAIWLDLPIETDYCLTRAKGLRANLDCILIAHILSITEEEVLFYWDMAETYLASFNSKQSALEIRSKNFRLTNF